MFKLIQLSSRFFAIVKSSEKTDQYPINVYGFIEVIEFVKNIPYVLNGVSKELENSNELEELKKKAVMLTEEAIAEKS